jgi:ferrous iron transport protein B
MKKIKVALVGQPNVGKSHLINAISGAKLHVGNFAGVTVEKKEVVFEKDDYEVTIVDLPGTYSLNAYSPDEEVAKNYLLNEEYDLIINVLDANALQRNLVFSLQLLDLGRKLILAVNMIDELEKGGGTINAEEISAELGVPVMLVSAKENRGIGKLVQKILEMYEFGKPPAALAYDHRIEEMISPSIAILENDHELGLSSRFVALRLFENDKDVYKMIHERPVFLEFHEEFGRASQDLKALLNEDTTAEVMTNARIAMAKGIASKSAKIKHKDEISERVDGVLIHQLFGIPIFLFLMWSLFQLTFTIGQIPQEYIGQTFARIADLTKMILPANEFSTSLTDGAIPAIGAIVGFLPNILILFFGINMLEQTGYMARVAFLLDGIMKRFGLHGKAFIPLMTGFGCSVPAYMAARTLRNPKDKLITMLIVGFFSCSARMPVYILFISAFFAPQYAGNVLFGIYVTGLVLGVVAAKILRETLFKGEAEPFVLEMPRYRWPSLRSILKDLQIKGLMFIKKAGIFIGAVGMAVWFLSVYPKSEALDAKYMQMMADTTAIEQNSTLALELESKKLEMSYIGQFGHAIEPVFAPLGFDWKLSVATVTALAAKEVAVATLSTLYSVKYEKGELNESLVSKVRSAIDFKSGIAFMIIIMIYSPCFAAMSTFFGEVKETKWRVFYVVYPNVLAWFLAFGAYRLLGILGF